MNGHSFLASILAANGSFAECGSTHKPGLRWQNTEKIGTYGYLVEIQSNEFGARMKGDSKGIGTEDDFE